MIFLILFCFSTFSIFSEEAQAPLPEAQLPTNEEIAFGPPLQEPSFSLLQEPSLSLDLPQPKPTKSPTAAVLLSALYPGFGHYYLGNLKAGTGLLGGASLSLSGFFASLSQGNGSLAMSSLFSFQAVSSYAILSSYRDTLAYNGTSSPFIPQDTFTEMSAAPFQWSVMKKPEVWGGLALFFTAAVTVSSYAYGKENQMQAVPQKQTIVIEPYNALPIAINEESIFRGFLQPSLMEKLPPWAAITTSSLLFGAAHIPNAQMLEHSQRWRYYSFSLPLITSFGAYAGYLSYKNHSLKEAVAIHAWYDFILMALSAYAQRASFIPESPAVMGRSFAF